MPQTITYRGKTHVFPDGVSDAFIGAALRQSDLDDAVEAAKGARANERRIYAQAEGQKPSALGLAGTGVKSFVSSVLNAPVAIGRMVSEAATDPMTQRMGIGPAVVKRLLVDPAMQQGKKAVNAPSLSEAIGYGAAAALPMMGPMAAGIGEKLGTGDPIAVAEAAGELAALVAGPKAVRETLRGAQRIGAGTQQAGMSGWLRSAKIKEATAKRTNTFRKTGDIGAAEREIATTILDEGLGRISQRNVNAARGRHASANARIVNLVNNSEKTVSPRPIFIAMEKEVAKMRREFAPDGDIAAARSRVADVRDQFSGLTLRVRKGDPGVLNIDRFGAENLPLGPFTPVDVVQARAPRLASVRETQDFAVNTGRRNSAKFAQRGQPVSPGVSRVDMAGGAAARELNKRSVQGLREASDQASTWKPAADAMIEARRRGSHHDPIGLTQATLANLGLGGLLAVLQRQMPLSALSQSMYTRGGQLSRLPTPNADAVRAALLASLSEDHP